MKFPEKYYALIPVALFCLFYTYQAIGFPAHDFANYYFGGKFLADGHFTTGIYFPYWFNNEIAALGHRGIFASYAPNTPFLAVLFYPFSWLPLETAKLLFNGVSLLLLLYGLNRLVSFYKVKPIYLMFLPVLFLVPIKNNLLFGQAYFLLFFLLTESWLAYEKRQFKKMAIFLSLAILLKVFPAILIVLLLFRKQYKPLLYVLASCAILVFVSMLFTGSNIWIFYLSNVLPRAANGEIATAFVDNYQSVFMFLKRLFVYDAVENPEAIHYPVLFSVLVIAFKAALIAIGFYVSRKIPDSLLVFSYWILAMILLSPYGSTYTFILLLVPFFALLKSNLPDWKKALGMALLFAINNVPLAAFMHRPFPVSYSRLLLLVLFACLLLWMVYKAVNWKMVGLVTALPLLLLLLPDESVDESQAFGKDLPILIYDYKIQNHRLTYYYWDEKGENHSAAIPVTDVAAADLTRNQVYFFGKRMTADNGNKRKPVVINGKTLLYLSDHGRGIGFYTLRKIALK